MYHLWVISYATILAGYVAPIFLVLESLSCHLSKEHVKTIRDFDPCFLSHEK